MNNDSTSGKSAETVAVLTMRTVKPDCKERFEAVLHDFIAKSVHTEGQLRGQGVKSLLLIFLWLNWWKLSQFFLHQGVSYGPPASH